MDASPLEEALIQFTRAKGGHIGDREWREVGEDAPDFVRGFSWPGGAVLYQQFFMTSADNFPDEAATEQRYARFLQKASEQELRNSEESNVLMGPLDASLLSAARRYPRTSREDDLAYFKLLFAPGQIPGELEEGLAIYFSNKIDGENEFNRRVHAFYEQRLISTAEELEGNEELRLLFGGIFEYSTPAIFRAFQILDELARYIDAPSAR